MESLEFIKTRIQSIVSTRQITQSMRLISTSRVSRARASATAGEPFLKEARLLLKDAVENAPNRRHPYLRGQTENRAAVIVINGDRGLCGGYNINVNRHAAALIKSLSGDVRIVTVGTKARDFCRRRYKGKLAHSLIGVSDNPAYDEAAKLAAMVRGWYDDGEVDSIHLVSTRFESVLVQTPESRLLLPFDAESPSTGGIKTPVRCEPGGDAFLEAAAALYLSACLFGAMLEASACEQSARVVSMDAAVKNADEMIEKLTLIYNQARQGAITQELTEIVAGADAV